jgi:hypothetical protein
MKEKLLHDHNKGTFKKVVRGLMKRGKKEPKSQLAFKHTFKNHQALRN